MTSTRVVAAFIQRSTDDAVLLQLRRPDRDYPLTWECPGGKVEPGESDVSALQRELLEELNLDVNDVMIDHEVIASIDFPAGPETGRTCTVVFYTAIVGTKTTKLLDAIAVGWFKREALSHVPLTPGNARLFKSMGWV